MDVEKYGGRDSFHLLVHTLGDCNERCWARPKPGIKSSLCIDHTGGRSPSPWAIFGCFCQAINRELSQKWSMLDVNQQPYQSYIGCSVGGAGFTCYATKLLLCLSCFNVGIMFTMAEHIVIVC